MPWQTNRGVVGARTALAALLLGASGMGQSPNAVEPTAASILRRSVTAVRALTAVELAVTAGLGEGEEPPARDPSARILPMPNGIGLEHRCAIAWTDHSVRLRLEQRDGGRLLRTLIADGASAISVDHRRGEFAAAKSWQELIEPMGAAMPIPYLEWHGLKAGAMPRSIVACRVDGSARCDDQDCDVLDVAFDHGMRDDPSVVSTIRLRIAIARSDGLPRRWRMQPPADVVADPQSGLADAAWATSWCVVVAAAPRLDETLFATRPSAGLRRVEVDRLDGMSREGASMRSAARRIAAIGSLDRAHLAVGEGEVLPDAAATAIDGAPVSLAALRGRAVVALVWCGADNEAAAELAALRWIHVRTRASGAAVEFLAVQWLDSAADQAEKQAKAAGLTMPVVAKGRAVAKAWQTSASAPTWIILDPAGRVVAAYAGPRDPADTAILDAIESARPK